MLALLRFMSTSLLAFLLLSPVVKSLYKKVEKPIIVIAADNSQSVLLNKDSSFYRKELPERIRQLAGKLEDKYYVRTYAFGGDVGEEFKLDYSDKQTNLSGLYDHIYNAFYNQNIGAVVTLTDGIYNQGQNPLFTAQKINAPFFTVALGDTTPQNDVTIRDVQYNRIVYAGNYFPLEIGLRSKGYKNRNVQVSVTNKGRVVFNQNVNLDQDKFFAEIPAKIEADAPGLQHYHISVTRMEGEISYVNNSYDVFIDVLDSRKKILLVSLAPHPDIAALRNSIERSGTYEVDAFTYSELLKNGGTAEAKLRNYQLAILHQLPGLGEDARPLIDGLNRAGVSAWYILGSRSNLAAVNNLDAGMNVTGTNNRTNEAGGWRNPQFSLFILPDELDGRLNTWPPLITPFGDYKLDDRQSVLLWQQIGKVKSEMPLLLFSNRNQQKSAILAGEGIWRWYLQEYSNTQNHETVDELVNKVVQYLSVKTDSRPFRVRPAKNLFFEDEHVSFEAEVYNQSFEPVKDALVEMKIRDADGKAFNFTFQPRGNAYALDAGLLPAGTYTYTAHTKTGGKPYSLSGEFIVKKVELEYLETVADHTLLNTLSAQQGGKLLYPKDMDKLPELIEAREDIQPVAYMQTDFKDLVHFKVLFFILLALLAGEWFLRKYFGAY